MTTLPLELLELTDWLWCLRTPVVACYAIRDRDGVVLVDANVAGQGQAIIAALAGRLDVPEDAVPLRQLVLTHAHADHYGSALQIARRTGADLLGPAEEADAFAGRRPLPAPRLLDRERPLFERITPDLVPPPSPVELDRALRPGDRLDGEIGAELVAAPGHTPGQLVVWIPTHRTLIAGDALATHDGALLSESSTLTPTTRRKQPRGCSTSFGHPGSAWLMERHSQATSAAGSTPPRRCAFK